MHNKYLGRYCLDLVYQFSSQSVHVTVIFYTDGRQTINSARGACQGTLLQRMMCLDMILTNMWFGVKTRSVSPGLSPRRCRPKPMRFARGINCLGDKERLPFQHQAIMAYLAVQNRLGKASRGYYPLLN